MTEQITRRCGDCQACCKLMPMRADSFDPVRHTKILNGMVGAGMIKETEVKITAEWDKPAGERCRFQRHGKGCAIYERRPFGCRVWQCEWLQNTAGDTARPDRLHMVIDPLPDFVQCVDDQTSTTFNLPVIQVWCDPKYPDAHRDPAFRAWLLERSQRTGEAALIRFNERDAMMLAPPNITADHEWHERTTGDSGRTKPHTPEEVEAAVGKRIEIIP